MTRRRGQAVVELALGLLVFTTVLLFGIHFAEMGWMGAKLHEANAAAVWDSTAYRSYQFGQWYDASRVAVNRANANATRYQDWDGRASAVGSAPRLAMTLAEPLNTRCARPVGLGYGLDPYAPRFGEPGGIACSSSADLTPFRIPSSFVEGARSGFSAARHVSRGRYGLCGTGALTFGRCGTLSVLLGDDALNHGRDALECGLTLDSPVPCRGNTAFYAVTYDTWNRSMQLTAGWPGGWTGRPEAFADDIAPGLPSGRITGFYLSFRGEESAFYERVNNGGSWQTNPMDAVLDTGVPAYRVAYSRKRACSAGGYCWLGKFPCN